MILMYALLAIVFLFIPTAKVTKPINSIYGDYISQDNTLSIKGLFTIIVMMSHFRGYVKLPTNMLNTSFSYVTDMIGQLMVAIFFFYSGFGISESIKKHGMGVYLASFPKKRLFGTWLSFAICICFYIIAAWIIGEQYSIGEMMLAFTGWTSIGNSNWFMFVTFVLYIILLIAFKCTSKDNTKLFTAITFILCIALFIFLYYLKESYWWDTLLCFPIGMVFSLHKNSIDKGMSRPIIYWSTLFTLLLVFGITYKFTYTTSQLFYLVTSVCFCLLIVCFTMKVKIRSTPLKFVGKHVFSIYILQRLVYMFVAQFIDNAYLFFIVSVMITIILAALYDYMFGKLKAKIFI